MTATAEPTVITSADPGWEAARAAFNAAVDQRPAGIVRARDADEIAAALRLAAQRGLRVAPQSTGHGAAALPALGETLLLRTDALAEVAVDAAAGTVAFGPGARAADVVAAAAAHGLALPAGFARTVGLAGYALGGGIGWLARRRGFAAHAIEAVDLVTADGRLRRADADRDPELLWALRGGLAPGVVVRVTMRAEPLATVHGGAMYWPVERAAEVLGAWLEVTAAAPDDLTSCARILALPPLPAVPEPLRGRTWCVVESVHSGAGAGADRWAAAVRAAAEHDALLAPLRALGPAIDTVAPLPVAALGMLHGDPEEPVPVVGHHALLDALDGEAIAALLDVAGAGSGSPLLCVDLRQLGGALARGAADDGPLGPLDAGFALHAIGLAPEPVAEAAAEDRLASLRAALAPWEHPRLLANFCERRTPAERIHRPEALGRLRAVARRLDPDQRLLATAELLRGA